MKRKIHFRIGTEKSHKVGRENISARIRMRPVLLHVLSAFLLISVFIISGIDIAAQDAYWEGGVTIGSYGTLPRSGNYAASNAFPQDSKVVVTNTETGKTVEVRVVERLEDPRLFMELSAEAGKALGIEEDEVVQARVTPASEDDDPVSENMAQEHAYTEDPDRNPSAEVETPEEQESPEGLAILEEYFEEEEPETEETETEKPETEKTEKAAETPVEAEAQEKEVEEKAAEEEEVKKPSVDKVALVEPPPSEEDGDEELEDVAPSVEESEAQATKEAGPAEAEASLEEKGPSVSPLEEVRAESRALEVSPDDPIVPEKVDARVAEDRRRLLPRTEDVPRSEPVKTSISPELPAPGVKKGAERVVEEKVVPEPEETPEAKIAAEGVKTAVPRDKERSYRPVAPRLKVKEKEEAGPQVALGYRDAEKVNGEPAFAAAEPRLPKAQESMPEMATEAPEEEDVKVSSLPTPKFPEKERAHEAVEEEPSEKEEEPSEKKAEGVPEPKSEAESIPSKGEPAPTEKKEEKSPIPEDADIVLEPAEERPPEGGEETEKAEAEEAEKAESREKREKRVAAATETEEKPYEDIVEKAELTKSLSSKSYYLQLAAYQNLETAKRLAEKFLPRYPVTIYNGKDETFPYKVMVGPLKEDESGALLYSFTARGYRDAFVRRGR